MTIDPLVETTIRACVALLLASAARHKLRDAPAFRGTLAGYGLLPSSWTRAVAAAIPLLELAIAMWLASGVLRAPAAFSAAALLVVYAAAIAAGIARGRSGIDCGCAGPAARLPLGPALVVRNLVVASATLVVLLPVADRTLGILDLSAVAAAVAAMSASWLASERMLALAPRATALRAAMSHGGHA
jgi:uncharacterized membrane protein YphA (DoxX/SURF4 family)